MDHNSERYVVERVWTWLIVLMINAKLGESSPIHSDIMCLTSIKNSFEDPLRAMSTWEFNNSAANIHCWFKGVECWDISDGNILKITLSGMGLSGEFPQGIANCKSLTHLDLSNNHLYGSLPSNISTFIPYLTVLDLSSNNFSGEIPSVFFIFSVGFLSPLSKFILKRLLAMVPAPRLESLSSSSKRMDYTMREMLEKYATRMSFLELCKATDNFSQNNIIAVGQMGTTTYEGVLSNGCSLAVKKLWPAPHIEHEFMSEIMTLGRLRHRNLVPLLGFCQESNDRFVIYKFMPNGSIHDCLFSYNGKAKIIEWPVRVRIAHGIAQGIAWLHQERVVHCGITSKCILLDENFNPRICGFGEAANPNGTHFMQRDSTLLTSYEKDVHGFGMVLLELITGTEYDEIVSSYDVDDDLSEHIYDLLNKAHGLGICVDYMVKQGFGDEISGLLSIAVKCVQCDSGGNWLSMEQVCQMLTHTATTTHNILLDEIHKFVA